MSNSGTAHPTFARLAAHALVAVLLAMLDVGELHGSQLLFMASAYSLLLLPTLLDFATPWFARLGGRLLTLGLVLVLASPLAFSMPQFVGDAQQLWIGIAGGAGLALVGGVAAGLLPGRLGIPSSPRFRAALLAASTQLVTAHFVVHELEGTLAQIEAGSEKLRVATYLATWGAAVLLAPLFAVRAASSTTTVEWNWVSKAATALALPGAIALVVIDRTQFSGLYDGFHVWLAFMAGALAILPIRVLLGWLAARGQRSSRWPAVGAALVVAALAVAVFVLPDASQPAFRAGLSDATHGRVALSLREPAPMRNFVREDLEALQYERHLDYDSDRQGKLNIIVISIDTLRADYVGEHEPHGEFAPRMSAFGKQSLMFSRAYTAGPRTAIGMGCFLLGRYSASLEWNLWIWRNGAILDPAKVTAKQLQKSWGFTTVPTFPEDGTIAERIHAAGYRTIGIPYAYYAKFFRRGVGFERGFDVYQVPRVRKQPSSQTVMNAAFEQFEKGLSGSKPVYQWIHLFDPHEAAAKKKDYQRLVKFTDAAVGDFIDKLRAAGHLDDTAVMIVADHGEAMGEHKGRFHGHSLYDEQVRVPMIVHIPDTEPRLVKEPASIIDVATTTVALAGGKLDGLDGVNLLALAERGSYPSDRPVFTEMHRYRGDSGIPNRDGKAVIMDGWKLYWNRKQGWFRLYDLDADPAEEHDRFAEEPARAQRLLQVLVSFIVPREERHPLPIGRGRIDEILKE